MIEDISIIWSLLIVLFFVSEIYKIQKTFKVSPPSLIPYTLFFPHNFFFFLQPPLSFLLSYHSLRFPPPRKFTFFLPSPFYPVILDALFYHFIINCLYHPQRTTPPLPPHPIIFPYFFLFPLNSFPSPSSSFSSHSRSFPP